MYYTTLTAFLQVTNNQVVARKPGVNKKVPQKNLRDALI